MLQNLHCFGSTFFGFCLTEQGEIGPDLFRKACEFGQEGPLSEHRDRQYRCGRPKHGSRSRTAATPRWDEFWSPSNDSPRSTDLDYPRDRNDLRHAPAMAQTYDPNYPVCLQVYAHDRLHRLQLYLDCPVQCDGFGPRSTMFRQSIFHTTRAGGAAGSVNVMPTGTT